MDCQGRCRVENEYEMTGAKLELLLEFGVILSSPLIYHFYLWKYKKVAKEILLKNAKIYLILYCLIGATGLFVFLS